MNVYKIGNKVTGIIRAYSSGDIGSIHMNYDNEPYTIVKSVEANLVFADLNTTITNSFNQLYYNNSKLSQIKISDILLNDKILNLIFSKSETKLVTKAENYLSDDNKLIYLRTTAKTVYQVFIYNDQGQLEKAIGTHNSLTPIEVQEANKDYLICYQYNGAKAFSFDRPANNYFTLDLIITGNEEDSAAKMTIHIDKCGLKIDKNMYFNQRSNTVDLTFTVINDSENYITIE